MLRLEAFERSVRLLEATASQLEDEVERSNKGTGVRGREEEEEGRGKGGGGDSEARVDVVDEKSTNLKHRLRSSRVHAASTNGGNASAAQLALELHMRDLEAARHMRDTEALKLARIDESERVTRDRLRALGCEVCPACRTSTKCDAFVRCCARTMCIECARAQLSQGVCALCDGCIDDPIVSVPCLRGMGTKMTKIGELVTSLKNDPVVLFVQWKSMVRGTRSFLTSLGVRVLLMEGSMTQRASTLAEFATSGVLLLCLEDCFAGLHLPHVRHIVFAHAIVAERKQVERYEKQAIARCVRYGQTEQVNVYSFVVSDTEEEKVWYRTHSTSNSKAHASNEDVGASRTTSTIVDTDSRSELSVAPDGDIPPHATHAPPDDSVHACGRKRVRRTA